MRTAVRQALHRGARAHRDAGGRPLGLRAVRHACSGSSRRWRPSWPPCSRCRRCATTIASACCCSPIASSTSCRRAKGRRHALRIIRDVLVHEPEGKGTDIGGALEYLSRMLPHRAIVFVISDLHRPRGWSARSSLCRSGTTSSSRRSKIRPSGRCPTSVWRGSSIRKRGRWSSVDTSDRRVRDGLQEGRRTPSVPRADSLLRRLAIDEVPVNTATDTSRRCCDSSARAVCASGGAGERARDPRAAAGGHAQRSAAGWRDRSRRTPFASVTRSSSPCAYALRSAPRSSFPVAPDSSGTVEPLDPVQITSGADSVAIDQTARYRLAAWRPWAFPDRVSTTYSSGSRSGTGVSR